MRNRGKITILESKFSLLSVEHGCIVSKDVDMTVAFRVELLELFTVISAEYETVHFTWHKAIRVLPNFTIVHKQDWFIKECYHTIHKCGQEKPLSFLTRAPERHLNERPYLHHTAYFSITKSNRRRMTQQSNFPTLCRSHLLSKEITNEEEMVKFMETVDQFERIINGSELIKLVRMNEAEPVGSRE